MAKTDKNRNIKAVIVRVKNSVIPLLFLGALGVGCGAVSIAFSVSILAGLLALGLLVSVIVGLVILAGHTGG